MKTITLKVVTIDYAGETKPTGAPVTLDYRTTLMGLLQVPKDPMQGATFEETAEAMPIWKKFRDLPVKSTLILLEDAEHKFLMECVTKNAKYTQRSYELFEMGQSLIDAPDHLIEAPSGKEAG